MTRGTHMKRVAWRWVVCAAVAGVMGAGTAAFAEADQPQRAAAAADSAGADQNVKQAFTLPYKEYKISFPTMGVIKEVKVKEGDVVKKGDMIMKQDDSEDQA